MADDRLLLDNRRNLPSQNAENASTGIARAGDLYGAQTVLSLMGGKLSVPNSEGSYFTALNATPGTGLAGHAAPTAAPLVGTNDTKPYLVFRNGNSVASKVRCELDYIRLTMTAIGTAGSAINWVSHVDAGQTSRYSLGTVNRLVANSPNIDLTPTSNAQIDVGPYVATAGSASTPCRKIDQGVVRPVIGVVADVYEWCFGPSSPAVGSIITTGTTQCAVNLRHCPVVLGPLQSLLFYLWSPSQSAASSYEVSVGWIER